MKLRFARVQLIIRYNSNITKWMYDRSHLKSNINRFGLGPICSRNMFSWGDDTCLSPALVCNGVRDCSDSSDEKDGCPGNILITY